MSEKYVEEKIDMLVKSVETLLESAANEADKVVDPYRRSILKRYPYLFIGLTTFGLIAVLYGFERLIDQTQFLADRPFMILLVGVMVLALTGTLYKKLK